jgi:hypothetical protein
VLVVWDQLVGETRPGDIGQLHLGATRGGGGPASLADVADTASGGLHHLIRSASIVGKKTPTEHDGALEHETGDAIASEFLVAAVRHERWL